MMFTVGDVCLRPLPPKVDLKNLGYYVVTVTAVNGSTISVTTGNGECLKCDANTLSLIASHKEVLKAFTEKGAELVGRVESR